MQQVTKKTYHTLALNGILLYNSESNGESKITNSLTRRQSIERCMSPFSNYQSGVARGDHGPQASNKCNLYV